MTRRASFWERRRAGVKAEEASVQQAAEEQALADQQVLIAEKSDEELLAEFDLPDPDTLKAGDDFTAFMAKAIPDHLRRRALRKLWVSDPVLACLDDLVDYADDYTQVSAVTDFTTSYQVGKGLREHIKDVAVKSAKASAPDAPLVGTPEEVAAMVQPTRPWLLRLSKKPSPPQDLTQKSRQMHLMLYRMMCNCHRAVWLSISRTKTHECHRRSRQGFPGRSPSR